jgi:hypothetical protein
MRRCGRAQGAKSIGASAVVKSGDWLRQHDPEKHVLDPIGDGNRFSEKIMREQNVRQALRFQPKRIAR